VKTKPIYLDDPYRREMIARIIDVIPEKEGVWRLILDETIFYPMGGLAAACLTPPPNASTSCREA
jgi:Ser-tRNA(Ala) deacylase AlaX